MQTTQPSDRYGCHNRPPIQTFGQPTCQFTKTWLGQTDKRCEGCKHKEVKVTCTKASQNAT